MTADFTKPLFIAGVTLSAFASGMVFSLSAITVPSLLAGSSHPSTTSTLTNAPTSSPSRLSSADTKASAAPETPIVLTQWRSLYAIGSKMGPFFFANSALCYLSNAWIHYAPINNPVGNALGGPWGTRRSYLFIAAAVVNLTAVPFTALFMAGINSELHRREELGRGVEGEWTKADPQKKSSAEGSTEDLIQRWGFLNGLRSLFPLAAAFLAFEAL